MMPFFAWVVDAGATPSPLERFETGHLFATVVVAGADRRFLVDTGASIDVLCSEFAATLGAGDDGKTVSAEGTDGDIAARITRLEGMTVGSQTFVDQKVAIIDCAAPAAILGSFDGVLGGSFFEEADVMVDLGTSSIETFAPGWLADHPPTDAVALPMRLPHGTIRLSGTLGTRQVGFDLDLGANRSSIDPRQAEAAGGVLQSGATRGYGASGNVTDAVEMKVDQVSLGPLPIGPLTFAAEEWGRHPNVGLDALAGRTLWISYRDRTLWVGPPH